jgi:hypothetical protein
MSKRSTNFQKRGPDDPAGAFVRTKARFERRQRIAVLQGLAQKWLDRAAGNPDASCEALTAGEALKEALSYIAR